ncbi:hypothetical protein AUEXF2481DRAFT_43324 [Aureobasidium subglaciale EXF-2481]|uniref:Uncharacterized protein n=1 Tax=Aureobasidium subglaciale (strain EXF-2481) TaxID=1043005 RepID=A0A074Y3E4_AURSE|nr:uncharacterized protein AUEXF2481DRAFT_43324 [Aureobasidium subglaciale EXF-2481]KEQ92225.1 hypothetical protein AUEXF2481DRAFT_43324 [Aureobasidium subglaciale EXF-2481]
MAKGRLQRTRLTSNQMIWRVCLERERVGPGICLLLLVIEVSCTLRGCRCLKFNQSFGFWCCLIWLNDLELCECDEKSGFVGSSGTYHQIQTVPMYHKPFGLADVLQSARCSLDVSSARDPSCHVSGASWWFVCRAINTLLTIEHETTK